MTHDASLPDCAFAPLAPDLIGHATAIVSAFIAHNHVAAAELPGLIASVHAALARLGTSAPVASEPVREPAVPVKKSVTPDYIVCLEDGKKFKSLRRHLLACYGLTPDQYRERWGLAADYPMVCASYSATRSSLAKQFGLGQPKPVAAA